MPRTCACKIFVFHNHQDIFYHIGIVEENKPDIVLKEMYLSKNFVIKKRCNRTEL